MQGLQNLSSHHKPRCLISTSLINLINLTTIPSPTQQKNGELAPTVSRGEIVKATTSYKSLTTFPYLPPSAIKTPPPGGWPQSDHAANLGKLTQPWDFFLTCHILSIKTGISDTTRSRLTIMVRQSKGTWKTMTSPWTGLACILIIRRSLRM